MLVFVLQFLLVFCGAEVPARRAEIPALAPEYPAHIFISAFLAKSFWLFSLEGVRNFASQVSSEISGGPEFPVFGPEYPAQGKFG